MLVGSGWNSPVAMGSMGCVAHSPCRLGDELPSGFSGFVQRSLGHQAAIPWWASYILEHGAALLGFARVGAPVQTGTGVALHQAAPGNAFRLTGAAPGQQERRENVLGGGGGTGGRKVGAAFLGPGRARTSGSKWKKGAVVWCQIAPSVPWGLAVRNKEEH